MKIDPGLKYGCEWEYNMPILTLKDGYLEAGLEKPSYAMLGAFLAIGLFIISISALGIAKAIFGEMENPVGLGVMMGFWGLLGLVILFFVIGYSSYFTHLHIDDSGIVFRKRFFWITKEINVGLEHLERVQCWAYSSGTGRRSTDGYYVCLHLASPLPNICLHSRYYLSELKEKVLGTIGFNTGGLMPREEALEEVLEKAGEIANALGIEHRFEKS